MALHDWCFFPAALLVLCVFPFLGLTREQDKPVPWPVIDRYKLDVRAVDLESAPHMMRDSLSLAGRKLFSWVDPNVSSKIFADVDYPEGEISVNAVRFGRPFTTVEIAQELDKLGYGPAKAQCLVAFAKKVKRFVKAVATGSEWTYPLEQTEAVYVPVVCGDEHDFKLGLRSTKEVWGGDWEILAVPKTFPETKK